MRFHARKSSTGRSNSTSNVNKDDSENEKASSQSQSQSSKPQKPKHHRTHTLPSLLRFPSSHNSQSRSQSQQSSRQSKQQQPSAVVSPGTGSVGGSSSSVNVNGGNNNSGSNQVPVQVQVPVPAPIPAPVPGGGRSRRATTAASPSSTHTPTLLLTPSQVSTPSITSPSYFSPQPISSGNSLKEPRSPATKRPPAWNTSGIDNSRGPPITLITRGTADLARRTQQPQQSQQQSQAQDQQQQQLHTQQAAPPLLSPPVPQQIQTSQHVAEFAFAQQQLLQSGLVSPGAISHTSHSSAGHNRRRRPSTGSVDSTPHPTQTNTPTTKSTTYTNNLTPHNLSRQNSARASRREQPMDSSLDDYSEYGSAIRGRPGDTYSRAGAGANDTSGTDGEQNEDLFMNIAADSSPRDKPSEAILRSERLRSRLARPSNRQSFPSNPAAPSVQSNSTTAQTSRLPPAIDTKNRTQHRRASTFSSTSRIYREETPMTPGIAVETPRTRQHQLSPKSSFSSKKDNELSPHQFLAQISNSRRRPSNSDVTQTPPNRTGTYRPSNLHYSASRDQVETPQASSRNDTASRADGTESLDSTGPAASVWDELDELKSRIRRIELGGKMPTTSGAVVASASERPRTATTSVTTVSSSPKQQRKQNSSPAESTVGVQTPQRIHPLLRDALLKTKQHVSLAVYRSLEATAAEALQLAELAGSATSQANGAGTGSVGNGASGPDRQVRRKADNLCRSLTELCIELCDTKPSIASPAIRNAVTAASRRPSVQINGESPLVRQSIEAENDALRHSSPSRALSRIEARRTSALNNIGGSRELSQDPPTPSQSHIPSRLNRAGTSLQRTRYTGNEDDEDLTLRAPSRAMTDFRDTRSANHTKRFSREYTSREPLPELQPAPALQHTASLRRPTVSGGENNLLFRDTRRYNIDRQNSPAYEKQVAADPSNRLSQPATQFASHRVSVGTVGLGRTASLSSRRFRSMAGE